MYSNVVNGDNEFKKREKNMKEEYKSTDIRKQHVIRARVPKQAGRKKNSGSTKKVALHRKKHGSSVKKQILKKNVQFLEDLGLKVKT